MLFYNTANFFRILEPTDVYIHLNSCGWYEGADTSVHTVRSEGRADFQLIYIKSGALQIGDNAYGAGTLYLYRPHTPQDYRVIAESTDYYWIHFIGSAFTEMLAAVTENAFDIGYCEPFIAFCREIVMHYADAMEENQYYIQGKLLSTIAELPLTKASQSPDAIDNAITYINEYYTNKLSNDELAKLCGLSKYYFIRRFTQKTGKTPQKYHTDLLLSKSTTMLTDTNLKIADIAESLGFEDSLYFSRIFKKLYGVSPMEYRKMH
ncbi:MAG: helix-turn-helix transcriptional regulator [Clostridia bacterium]|nr:helix-turn-helix transcriptional regulator [Clostridia bacterium]